MKVAHGTEFHEFACHTLKQLADIHIVLFWLKKDIRTEDKRAPYQ
jgi:hypothetical protein